MTPGNVTSAGPGALPLAALVLARRVRVLVAVTVVHTTVMAVAGWWAGGGPTWPGLVGFAAHLAISLGAALPVRWQFNGDPVSRQRRAARAMTVSFVVLAVYSAVDAVREALAPARPGEALAGAALGVAAAVALPVLVALDARVSRAEGVRGPAPAVLVAALTVVLVAATLVDLLAGTGPAVSLAAPAVAAVVAVLATREAWGAWHTA